MLSRALFLLAVAILSICAISSSAQNYGGPQPTPWPPVHTHTEIMWSEIDSGSTPQAGQTKKFYYNFPTSQMKVTGKYAFGSSLTQGPSITSYWLNKTLYMLIQLDFFGNVTETCQALDMGFGMPVPNWFLPSPGDNVTNHGSLFIARRGNAFDNNYYNVTWWSKDSPISPFNYFFMSNDKYEAKPQGAGFYMFAPSPMSIVANEYYDFKTVDSFPADTFALPAQCTGKKQRGIFLRTSSSASPVHSDEESFVAEIERELLAKKIPGDLIANHYSKMVKLHLFEMKLMGNQHRKI